MLSESETALKRERVELVGVGVGVLMLMLMLMLMLFYGVKGAVQDSAGVAFWNLRCWRGEGSRVEYFVEQSIAEHKTVERSES
jgi:hypothetical protein